MNKDLQKLIDKRTRYLQERNYIKAQKVEAQIKALTTAAQQKEQFAVQELFDTLTPQEKEQGTDLCTTIMLLADMIEGAATDLQALIFKVDHSAQLLLYQDVKKIKKLSNNIVRNVDAFDDEEFSASFGDLADHVKLCVQNIIYTERAKQKRLHP